MPILTERDYAKLASAAAKDLVDHQIPLNESIDKLAAAHEMNDEQLARLCEASNNAAFNALFEAKGKTGSDDRMVDFEVAKPKEILQKRVQQEKTANVRRRGIVDSTAFDAAWESRPLTAPSREEPAAEKTASVTESLPTASQLRRYAEQDARTLSKAIDHLHTEKISSEMRVTDAIADLTMRFRRIDMADQFTRFEKEAMCLHGAKADELLDQLRKGLRMPEVTRDYSKVAGRVVLSDETPEHNLFKIAVDHCERAKHIARTLNAYRPA